MDLIIGGAYQGKRELAKRKYGFSDADIYTCGEESGIVFGARCIDKIEEFTLKCVREGQDAVEIFKEHRSEWQDSVLICHASSQRSVLMVSSLDTTSLAT